MTTCYGDQRQGIERGRLEPRTLGASKLVDVGPSDQAPSCFAGEEQILRRVLCCWVVGRFVGRGVCLGFLRMAFR